ncbi:MAG: hypothetical protein AAGB10_00210 [Pseudomonadota bacterium]
MRRALGLALAAILVGLAFYLSRYWVFRLWDREGLLGLEVLRPQGGLVGRWLRGTDAAPFELVLWGCGVFLILTILQAIWNRIFPG